MGVPYRPIGEKGAANPGKGLSVNRLLARLGIKTSCLAKVALASYIPNSLLRIVKGLGKKPKVSAGQDAVLRRRGNMAWERVPSSSVDSQAKKEEGKQAKATLYRPME